MIEGQKFYQISSVGPANQSCAFWCVLLQACLGASAKEGERNVVEVTVDNEEGEEVTHTLLSMRVGGTEQVRECSQISSGGSRQAQLSLCCSQ